ncbi:MAG: hypothetical protein K6E50_13565 [Lachnospiraceae bacterium]|nr:hypothetical protein [Lachnospiraceae bacterium]
MKKKILAGLLSLAMVIGQLQPVSVAAAGDEAPFADSEYASEEDDYPEEDDLGEDKDFSESAPDAAGASSSAAPAVKDLNYGLIVSDPVKINDKTYHLTADVTFYGTVAYCNRKILPASDLQAEVSCPGLDGLLNDLIGPADAKGLVEWKFTAKKNKKIGADAYFTAKAVVKSSVAKSIGLKGKALRNFKKGISKLNKAAKSVKLRFAIVADVESGSEADLPAIKPVKINASNFPDANFRKVISGREYDRDGNHILDEEEIRLTINIYCEGKNIKSLKGVEHFVALQGLWCKDNKIKTMDLRNNKDLRGVWCSGNLFTTLDFTGNPELLWVYCYDCKLKSLNVSNNPKMAFVECNTNPLTVLDLSHNPELEHLTCGTCELSVLDLGNNPKLTHLDAFRNKLKTLDLSHCPKMRRLDIWDNEGLGSIDLSNNPELQYYNCANNDAVSVDVSRNPELQKLICSYNDITELDLSHNPKLVYLDCADNRIEKLDLTNNGYMHFLQAFINDFTELNIGSNPFLVKTWKEGEKQAETNLGAVSSWTIDYGGDTSVGGDTMYFLCLDDKVNILSEATGSLPSDDDASLYSDLGAPEDDLLRREEVVQTLYEMAGSPRVDGLSTRFTDIETGSPYEAALLWGEAQHICTGFPYMSSDTFGTGRWITRQDLALMLMRYSEYANYKRAIDFGRSDDYIDYFDIDFDHWEAMCWSATWQILEGRGEDGAPKDRQRIEPLARVSKADLDAAIKRLKEVNQ